LPLLLPDAVGLEDDRLENTAACTRPEFGLDGGLLYSDGWFGRRTVVVMRGWCGRVDTLPPAPVTPAPV
jgi:hypothetical protein